MNAPLTAEQRVFGPFFAVLEKGGRSLVCVGNDPVITPAMGPYDNHTRKGRKVIRVMVVELPEDTFMGLTVRVDPTLNPGAWELRVVAP